jgi:hypothetical protein
VLSLLFELRSAQGVVKRLQNGIYRHPDPLFVPSATIENIHHVIITGSPITKRIAEEEASCFANGKSSRANSYKYLRFFYHCVESP